MVVVLCDKMRLLLVVYVVPASSARVCGGKAAAGPDSSSFSCATASASATTIPLSPFFPCGLAFPAFSPPTSFTFLPSITSGRKLYFPPHPTHCSGLALGPRRKRRRIAVPVRASERA